MAPSRQQQASTPYEQQWCSLTFSSCAQLSLSGLLFACRVVQNGNGTVTATYTFGDEYAAALKPILLNGTAHARITLVTVHARMTLVHSTC